MLKFHATLLQKQIHTWFPTNLLQDTDGQFIGLTVAEDIAFVLENDCMAQEEMFRKVDGVAETVEVKELLSHAPSEMSGGQKQRVSMAG